MNNIIRNVSKKKLNCKVPLVFLAIIIVAILVFVFLFQHLRVHNNKYTFSLDNSQCYVYHIPKDDATFIRWSGVNVSTLEVNKYYIKQIDNRKIRRKHKLAIGKVWK